MAPIGKFSGVTKTSFGKVDNVLAANIGGIDNVSLALAPNVTVLRRYDFENETEVLPPTTVTATGIDNFWVPNLETPLNIPTFTHAWFNDVGFGPNTFYDFGGSIGQKKFLGWNLGEGQTPSSYCGPNLGGAVSNILPTQADDQERLAQNADSKYIYAETSNSQFGTDKAHACYLVFADLLASMANTNNDLVLEFYVFASTKPDDNELGTLFLRGMNENSSGASNFPLPTSSNTTNFTAYSNTFFIENFPNTNSTTDGTDDWLRITVNINSMKDEEANGNIFHAFYFIYANALGYYGDLCIDNVSILEVPI